MPTSLTARALCLLLWWSCRDSLSAAPKASPPPTKAIAAPAQSAAELDRQATELEGAGKFAEALPLAKQAYETRRKLFGERHVDTAASVYLLGMLAEDQGDLAAAEAQYARVLKTREELLGREAPATAQVCNTMGNVLFQRGEFARAEALWRRALAIREKTAGPDDIETAKPINNLAAVRHTQGDAAGAVEYFRRALAIFEKRLGPDHPMTANTLNNLGAVHRELLGDLGTAENFLQRALACREKNLGPDHPLVAGTLSNLAAVLSDQGNYAAALTNIRRAMAIYGQTNGAAHPDTIRARNDLVVCLVHLDQMEEAEKLGLEAARISEEALGPDHPQTASTLTNLAELYRRKNQPAEAERYAARAEGISRRTFGPDHSDTCTALSLRAGALLDLGRREEATTLAVQVARLRERELGNVLSFTTEAQRLAFQANKAGSFSLLATLGAAEPLGQTLLRTKGAILDSLLEDRLVALASTDPARRRALDDARALRRELTALQLEAPDDLSPEGLKKREARKGELAASLEAAEGSMARQVAGVGRARRALGVTVAQVQAALPKEAVLVDFVRYAHELGHDLATEERYGAVVLARDQAPRWVPLGSAAKLDEQMRLYRQAVRNDAAGALELEEVLGSLYRLVWRPLEGALPAAGARVFVSPDSELNFLSFATLLTPDDRFLAERHPITCLGSGRDVLPTGGSGVADGTPKQKSLLVFANPRMDANAPVAPDATPAVTPVLLASAEPAAALPRQAYRDLRLGALPGAEREAQALSRFAEAHRWKSELLVGPAARKRRLLAAHRPSVLHLATHGFFLPPPGDPAPVAGGTSTAESRRTIGLPPSAQWLNPMRRSGLALAGAGGTLEAWAAGRTPGTEDDGIVTAEEVSTLDLHGTWLVVLSACDSGGGEARAGEGVLGLRRGFTLAGAQNLLLTLWPVGDEETSALILDFYARADATGDPALALAEVQREHLVRLRRKDGLSAAVRLAGGFILSSVRQ